MNIQEYISSGILETYVLGLTSEQENLEIELLCKKHAEIKAEIETIEKTLNEYALKHAVKPSEYMKERVIKAVTDKKETKIVEMYPKRKNNNYMRLAVAACITLLAVSTFLNLYLLNKLGKAKQEMAELNSKNTTLASDFSAIKTGYEETKAQLGVLNDPSGKMVCLMGLPKSPTALVHVYWNASKKAVYVEVNNLPAAPDSMQYQLWAIKDGQPVDAGMINLRNDSASVYRMKDIEEAQAFAITLEKKGGSSAPEGEMYVMGKI